MSQVARYVSTLTEVPMTTKNTPTPLDVPYGITRRLEHTNLDTARARITAALQAQGFGVLTEIDVSATLKKKLDVTLPPYVILGACNPKLAHTALSQEPGVGLLLPCNVVVAEYGADAVISAASPRAMFDVAGDSSSRALLAVADEAEERLRRAVAAA
jgi:uncharacterized protein (DUF302 family)